MEGKHEFVGRNTAIVKNRLKELSANIRILTGAQAKMITGKIINVFGGETL